MAVVCTRDVVMFNPLGMYDVSAMRTDLETVLNSYQQGVQFLIWGNDACSMDTCRFLQLSYLLHVYMDLPLAVTSTRLIMHHSPSMKFWTAFFDALCCSNSETGCTCHVCVLRRWWWRYSALGALVCISWQMGCSAPLLLHVMMSHVPVYQTGHTQLSPHLLLSQSPILLLSVFISYCTAHALSLLICPSGKDSPLKERVHLYFQTHHTYVCTCKLQSQLWLHGIFVALSGKARTTPTTWYGALIITRSWCVLPISVPQGKWQSLQLWYTDGWLVLRITMKTPMKASLA